MLGNPGQPFRHFLPSQAGSEGDSFLTVTEIPTIFQEKSKENLV